ncbi:MAG: hypothetical protein ABII82_04580 [Verrucomicrobiota bacterium]
MLRSINDFIFASPVQALIVWGGVAVLVLLLFLREPRTLTLSKSEGGRLQISRHALHRLIEACCQQLGGVASARAEVVRKGGKFNTVIRLKIRPNAKLDAIQGYLTEEVADIFKQNLGIAEVGTIEVKVTGVIPEASNGGF